MSQHTCPGSLLNEVQAQRWPSEAPQPPSGEKTLGLEPPRLPSPDHSYPVPCEGGEPGEKLMKHREPLNLWGPPPLG